MKGVITPVIPLITNEKKVLRDSCGNVRSMQNATILQF